MINKKNTIYLRDDHLPWNSVPITPVIFETSVDMLVSFFGLLFFSVARIFRFGELVIVDAIPSLNEEYHSYK